MSRPLRKQLYIYSLAFIIVVWSFIILAIAFSPYRPSDAFVAGVLIFAVINAGGDLIKEIQS